MKFKSMLEGLALSVPLILGSPGEYVSNSCAGEINNTSLNSSDEEKAFEKRFEFATGLTIIEGLFLYFGYRAVRRLMEPKDYNGHF